MNIIKFQILVLIDKYNKVTDVARELDIKQPTVTFHMKSLEKDMGIPLYSAQQGRIILTNAGKAILPHAKQILSLIDTVNRTVQQYSSLEQGEVYINTDSLAAENILPEFMSRFASEYPGIEVRSQIFKGSSEEDSEGVCSLFVRSEKQPGSTAGQDFTNNILLQEDQFVLVYAKNHPLMMSPSVKPSDLSNILFVEYESQGLLEQFTEQFTAHTNIHLWKRIAVSTPQAALRAVSEGNTITFLPLSMLASSPANVTAIAIPGLEEKDTMFATYLYRRKTLSPAASAFWDYISLQMHPSDS